MQRSGMSATRYRAPEPKQAKVQGRPPKDPKKPRQVWLLWLPDLRAFDESPDEHCYNCCFSLEEALDAIDEWAEKYPGLTPPEPVQVK